MLSFLDQFRNACGRVRADDMLLREPLPSPSIGLASCLGFVDGMLFFGSFTVKAGQVLLIQNLE